VVKKFALETEKLMHSLYPTDRTDKIAHSSLSNAILAIFPFVVGFFFARALQALMLVMLLISHHKSPYLCF